MAFVDKEEIFVTWKSFSSSTFWPRCRSTLIYNFTDDENQLARPRKCIQSFSILLYQSRKTLPLYLQKNSAMVSDELPTSTSAKREKLIGFSNWAQWASLTKSMLIEKDVWDLVKIDPWPLQQNASRLWDHKEKEDWIAVETAGRIIWKGVSDNLFNNIIDIDDPQAMWAKLQSVCSHVGQGVVYLIFQELFNYPKVNKLKGYEKTITSYLRTSECSPNNLRPHSRQIAIYKYNSIAIVIALDSIHNDFEIKTSSLLETITATRLLTKSSKYSIPPKLKTSANKLSASLMTWRYHSEGLWKATTVIWEENKRPTATNFATTIINWDTLIETVTNQTNGHSQTEEHS